MSEIENLLAEILQVSCRCDSMRGYACPVHVPLSKLRKLLSPARGDGVDGFKFIRELQKHFGNCRTLADIEMCEEQGWTHHIEKVREAARAAVSLTHDLPPRDAVKTLREHLDKEAVTPTPPSAEGEYVGWKLAMRVLQSDLYQQLDDSERAECDALVAKNPYAAAPVSTERMVEALRYMDSWLKREIEGIPHSQAAMHAG